MIAVEALQIARDLITSVVTIVGGTVALLGYRAWHRQILGKTEHDAARNLLVSALRLREAIREVRRVVALLPSAERALEYRQALPDKPWPNELWEQRMNSWKKQLDPRIELLQGRIIELRVAELEVEALWGSEAKAPVAPLGKLALDVQAAVDDYFWTTSMCDPSKIPDFARATWSTIGIGELLSRKQGEAQDMFGKNVDAAVSELERYYRPKLQLKGR